MEPGLFHEFYSEIVSLIGTYTQEIGSNMCVEHVLKMVDYTVKGGKLARGTMCSSAFLEVQKILPESENAKIGYIIGWAIELLQASFLIADDLMDQSEKRRGKPCWYLTEGIGNEAVNDAIIMELIAIKVLYKLEEYLPVNIVMDLIHVCRKVNMITSMGQTLDFLSSMKTKETYESIAHSKTSYYTIYLPLALPLIASQKFTVEELERILLQFCMRLGFLFQAQDDWIDVFGDSSKTGKIGTDIVDGKITWLITRAYELSSSEQKARIDENLGKPGKEQFVKQVYEEVEISKHYLDFEKSENEILNQELDQMDEKLPKNTIRALLRMLFGRKA